MGGRAAVVGPRRRRPLRAGRAGCAVLACAPVALPSALRTAAARCRDGRAACWPAPRAVSRWRPAARGYSRTWAGD
eukprot:8170739-Alexandrium_andersonii.AAC.1